MTVSAQWAIHRGGAVFIDGAVGVGIHGCIFDQVTHAFLESWFEAKH